MFKNFMDTVYAVGLIGAPFIIIYSFPTLLRLVVGSPAAATEKTAEVKAAEGVGQRASAAVDDYYDEREARNSRQEPTGNGAMSTELSQAMNDAEATGLVPATAGAAAIAASGGNVYQFKRQHEVTPISEPVSAPIAAEVYTPPAEMFSPSLDNCPDFGQMDDEP